MSFDKKRELLPILNNVIKSFIDLSDDIAILEFHDNDKASRRVKLRLSDIKNHEITVLIDAIKEVRVQINNKHKQKKQKNE